MTEYLPPRWRGEYAQRVEGGHGRAQRVFTPSREGAKDGALFPSPLGEGAQPDAEGDGWAGEGLHFAGFVASSSAFATSSTYRDKVGAFAEIEVHTGNTSVAK